jgi:hypothetical protein
MKFWCNLVHEICLFGDLNGLPPDLSD